jgi:hypothetical protein
MKRKEKQPRKACSMCVSAMAVAGEKYCIKCRKVVLSELKASGYLRDEKPPTAFNDERGRNARSSKVLGGSCEIRTDGDD